MNETDRARFSIIHWFSLVWTSFQLLYLFAFKKAKIGTLSILFSHPFAMHQRKLNKLSEWNRQGKIQHNPLVQSCFSNIWTNILVRIRENRDWNSLYSFLTPFCNASKKVNKLSESNRQGKIPLASLVQTCFFRSISTIICAHSRKPGLELFVFFSGTHLQCKHEATYIKAKQNKGTEWHSLRKI